MPNQIVNFQGTIPEQARNNHKLEEYVQFNLKFTEATKHDDQSAPLPNAAATDDLGIITPAAWGTNTVELRSIDLNTSTSTSYAFWEYVMPPEYADGQRIKMAATGKMSVAAQVSAALDFDVYKCDKDGTVSAQMVTTDEISINSSTNAEVEFTVDPDGVVTGDKLLIRLKFDGDDTGGASGRYARIFDVSIKHDCRG